MKRFLMWITLALIGLGHALASDGLVTRASPHPVAETMDLIEAAVRGAATPASGLRIFARIDFQKLSGGKIRPNQAIVFGGGGALPGLADKFPAATMDLPIKIVVWEDEAGMTWISYNSTSYLKQRHGIVGADDQLERIGKTTQRFIDRALQ